MASKIDYRPSLATLLNPSIPSYSGEDSEPLNGSKSSSKSDSEKVILDAIEAEYNFRWSYRHKSFVLIIFLIFASVYFGVIYTQISIKRAYELNSSITGLLPKDYSTSYSNKISNVDALYDWLNESIIQTIWNDPECNNGVCSAPGELPSGIFPNKGCKSDCGDLETVIFLVTVFNTSIENVVNASAVWNMSMCWNETTKKYPDVIQPTSSTGCILPNQTKVISTTNSEILLEIQFIIAQGPNVKWKIDIPFKNVNAFINMTIESRIVKIYGGPKGFDAYVDNSFANLWLWNDGGVSYITGNNFIDLNLCKKSKLQESNQTWPFSTSQPNLNFSCYESENSTHSFNIINPARLYFQLKRQVSRSLQSSNKQNTFALMGVHIQQFRKPYSEITCGNSELVYNETEEDFVRDYERYKKWGPWCDSFDSDGITPYGKDPVFSPPSSIYNSSLNVSDYYSDNETVDGIPYGFFDTTYSFETRIASEDAFFVLFDINLSSERAQYLLAYLKEGGFIDHYSESIIVRVLMYNDILKIFLELKFSITFEDSGGILLKQKSFFLQTKSSTVSQSFLVIFTCCLAISIIFDVVVFLDSFFPTWRKIEFFYKFTLFPPYNLSKSISIKDYIRWNWLDLLSNFFFLASSILLLIIYKQTKHFNPASSYPVYENIHESKARILKLNLEKNAKGYIPAEDMNEQFEIFENIYTLKLAFIYLIGINTLLMFMKALKLCHFHPRLGIMTRLLRRIIPDMASIAFIWVLMSIPYALIGMIAFGDRVNDFHCFWLALSTLFKMVLGQIDIYESLLTICASTLDRFPVHIFFWTYMIIAYIILLNFTIAVVVDMFSLIKEKNNEKKQKTNAWPSELNSFFTPKNMYPMFLLYSIIKDHKVEGLRKYNFALFQKLMKLAKEKWSSWKKKTTNTFTKRGANNDDNHRSSLPSSSSLAHLSTNIVHYNTDEKVANGNENIFSKNISNEKAASDLERGEINEEVANGNENLSSKNVSTEKAENDFDKREINGEVANGNENVSSKKFSYKKAALVIDGREISNSVLYDLIESRLIMLEKNVTDELVKSVVFYVLKYYGVSKEN